MDKVVTYMHEQGMTPDSRCSLIVGISGGADSVALLHLLHELGYHCIAAHCNFQLRSEESERDEAFVRQLTKELSIELETVRFNTRAYASQHGISIEMAARDLRYQWFTELAEKHKAVAIAIGHHADDTIETILLNLIRGTGLKGLTGIQPVNGNIIRPLLCLNRKDIIEYLHQHKQPYVEDSSNNSDEFLRNKIRHQLIPLLQTMNPGIRDTLLSNREYLQQAYQFQQQQVLKLKAELVSIQENRVYVQTEEILRSGNPFVLYEILKDYGFNSAQVRSVYSALGATSGKRFYTATHEAVKDRYQLIINKLALNTQHSANFSITLLERDEDTEISRDLRKVHLDADKIKFPIQIRKWLPGDFFYPLGMNQRKKISDFLIDLKIDRITKENTWVLIDADNTILWVVGYRIDNRYRITDTTTQLAEIMA